MQNLKLFSLLIVSSLTMQKAIPEVSTLEIIPKIAPVCSSACRQSSHNQTVLRMATNAPAAQVGLLARVSAWLAASKNKATGFAQDTWAQVPSTRQMSVMVANALDESVFQLTAPGGYVRQHPVTVGASVAAVVAVTAAGYYAYSKGYFGKAYKALKARLA
jgi:hypothetical protein